MSRWPPGNHPGEPQTQSAEGRQMPGSEGHTPYRVAPLLCVHARQALSANPWSTMCTHGVSQTPPRRGHEWTHHLPEPRLMNHHPGGKGIWGHRLPGHRVCVGGGGDWKGHEGPSGGRLPLRKLVQLICGLLYGGFISIQSLLENVNETFSG